MCLHPKIEISLLKVSLAMLSTVPPWISWLILLRLWLMGSWKMTQKKMNISPFGKNDYQKEGNTDTHHEIWWCLEAATWFQMNCSTVVGHTCLESSLYALIYKVGHHHLFVHLELWGTIATHCTIVTHHAKLLSLSEKHSWS